MWLNRYLISKYVSAILTATALVQSLLRHPLHWPKNRLTSIYQFFEKVKTEHHHKQTNCKIQIFANRTHTRQLDCKWANSGQTPKSHAPGSSRSRSGTDEKRGYHLSGVGAGRPATTEWSNSKSRCWAGVYKRGTGATHMAMVCRRRMVVLLVDGSRIRSEVAEKISSSKMISFQKPWLMKREQFFT